MSATYRELTAFRDKLEAAANADGERFLTECTKELAARLLRKIIKRTPVGQYPSGSGKVGGTLRRGWTGGEKSNAGQFVDSLSVTHRGNTYIVEIKNDVEYAPYVEYGHRTRGGKGWVQGQFMMTISEQELRRQAPAILEKKLYKWLSGLMR